MGAVQLIVLGIIGEYLGRLYEQSKQRPLFIIDKIYQAHHSSESHAESISVTVLDRGTRIT